MTNLRPLLVKLFWVATLVAVWEVLRVLLKVSPLLLPSVPSILGAFCDAWTRGELGRQLLVSMGIIGLGAAAALFVALSLALIAGLSPALSSLVDTLNTLLHPLPGVALLPVVILWFGTGTLSVLAVVLHSVLWPLLTNLRAGYRSMPATYLLVGRNLGLRGTGLFLRVIVPASVPFLLSGLRIAWARAWRALISAEMIFGAVAGSGGVGWFLYSQRVFMNSSGLFAGILLVMVVGVLMEEILFTFLEERTIRRWGAAR